MHLQKSPHKTLPEMRKCFIMSQNYMVRTNSLNDTFGSLNFIKCCHKSDNKYNYGFQTLLWRLFQNFGTFNILILKFFLILLNCTEHVIGKPVVAYHKNHLPIFDNISYRKFDVIFQTELLGRISFTYLPMPVNLPVNANLPSK